VNSVAAGRRGPLVLVHGAAGASWRDFAPLLPLLGKHREVVALRTPGHYEAPDLPANADLSLEAFVDRLEEELDRRGLEQPDVVGDSTGGLMAIELGRRGRARAVVAISPAGMWSDDEAREAERNLMRAYRLGRRVLPLGVMLARTSGGRWLLFDSMLGTRGAKLTGEDAGHVLRALAGSRITPDFIKANKDERGVLMTVKNPTEVRCPVLLIWGERDRLLPAEQGHRWKDALPEAELEELAGVGHHPQFDEPERVAELILEFLGRPAAASDSPHS
jgi:pimeloyl-ACP methyl ester carboxylesterase